MKYCFSTDQEEYYGEFDTIEEAVAEGRDTFERGDETVYVGEIVHATEFLRGGCKVFAESILEQIDEILYEEIHADEEILTMDGTHLEELGKMILEYVKKNADFHCFGVKNIKSY